EKFNVFDVGQQCILLRFVPGKHDYIFPVVEVSDGNTGDGKMSVATVISVISSLFVCGLLIGFPLVTSALSGDNVCSVQETYLTYTTVATEQGRQQCTYTWCWNIPPRSVCNPSCDRGECVAPDTCQCEAGWRGEICNNNCEEGRWGDNCANRCDCNDRGTCDPETGICYVGRRCESECSDGYYGNLCQYECRCQNNATCNHVTGTCTCAVGFRGPLCEERCGDGTHGQDCQGVCLCQNEARCDVMTGECTCTAGWKGRYCTEPCSPGTYGAGCDGVCTCYNGANCEPVAGQCICRPGYMGDRSASVNMLLPALLSMGPVSAGLDTQDYSCSFDTWGQNCSNQCDCDFTTTKECLPDTGHCVCAAGWKGPTCEETCQPPYYGDQCSKICTCQHEGQCHHVDGTCTCPAGYIGDAASKDAHAYTPTTVFRRAGGVFVNQAGKDLPALSIATSVSTAPDVTRVARVRRTVTATRKLGHVYANEATQDRGANSLEFTYGFGCRQNCSCVRENTMRCHHVTGECHCLPQYTGLSCSQVAVCDPGWYGPNCDRKCQCVTQNGVCDTETGFCQCLPGYMGHQCELICPPGSWGHGCAETCACNGTSSRCEHVTGQCPCPDGYTGVNCEETCPQGTWGPGCRKRCSPPCLYGHCHHVTGKCVCIPGYRGELCTLPCPAGSYGEDCGFRCQCDNGGTCRATDGRCDCTAGFTGIDCSLNTATVVTQRSEAREGTQRGLGTGDVSHHASGNTTSDAALWAVVGVAAVLLIALIVFIVVNRRKMKKLTAMIYTRSREEVIIRQESVSTPEGFANPVYGFNRARQVPSLPCQAATPSGWAHEQGVTNPGFDPPPYEATEGAVGGVTARDVISQQKSAITKANLGLNSPYEEIDNVSQDSFDGRMEAKARQM
ncbi:hypothetical protein BaRGS_00034987, partial [Batillaria attramentaria]